MLFLVFMGVEVKEQLVGIILYFLLPPYNPRSHTQVTGFGGQLLYLLSHLPCP